MEKENEIIKPKLLETIKIENGLAQNIEYHNKRLNYSRKSIFKLNDTKDLKEIIDPPKDNLYRCRVIYAEEIESVSYHPYKIKSFNTFKLIESDISYEYKYLNREAINNLFSAKDSADDIIILRNELVTDTSIANIALFDGQKWLTPSDPLLKGTVRERLLETGMIYKAQIYAEDLVNYKGMAIMNSMIGFIKLKDVKFI